MLANLDGILHASARDWASRLIDPDKKQLRFNEIVDAAKAFYPGCELEGVRELVRSCGRENSELYASKRPMWRVLRSEYGWMIYSEAKDERT